MTVHSQANQPGGGQCPEIVAEIVEVCEDTCTNSTGQCGSRMLCCSNGCAFHCMTPGKDLLIYYFVEMPSSVV